MSVLGRLGLDSSAEIASVRDGLADLGRAHHQTAHSLEELRAQVSALQDIVDPVRSRPLRDAVDSMLALVVDAVSDADAARRGLRDAERQIGELRSHVAALE